MSSKQVRFPTAKQFEKWLERWPEDVWLGVKNSSSSCPLANYLKLERSAERVCVAEHEWAVDGGRFKPMPEWAQHFVRCIDKLRTMSLGSSTSNEVQGVQIISRDQALRELREALKD